MNEEEWLACTNLTPMLAFLRGTESRRKLLLFACACYGRVLHVLHEGRERELARAVERLADHPFESHIVAELLDQLQTVVIHPLERLRAFFAVSNAACRHPERVPEHAAVAAALDRLRRTQTGRTLDRDALDRLYQAECDAECTAQCGLLRDMVGNPFRPVAPDPAWQTPNAVTLASTIYDERRWELLPLLADLLEEAGCPKEVSDHCRGSGPHARGCWVVDLVLGKE